MLYLTLSLFPLKKYKARLVLIRLMRLKLIAIYVIEASVPTIILLCVIREDVDDFIADVSAQYAEVKNQPQHN